VKASLTAALAGSVELLWQLARAMEQAMGAVIRRRATRAKRRMLPREQMGLDAIERCIAAQAKVISVHPAV
jgi:hypothetical protein